MGLTAHSQQWHWGQFIADQSGYKVTSPKPEYHSPQASSQGQPMDYQPLIHGQTKICDTKHNGATDVGYQHVIFHLGEGGCNAYKSTQLTVHH